MPGRSDPVKLPPLRDVIRQHGMSARKDLGQHFLLDTNLTDRIARSAILPPATDLSQGTTIEIGPGPGGLTRSLLSAGAAVLALEVDDRAIAAMADLADQAGGRLAFLQADALRIDPIAEATARGLDAPHRIVANLPYNVGTAMLVQWLKNAAAYERFTLMFQREVVDRLTARPGTKTYGRLSVLAQWLCETERLFNVPAAAFTPPPSVMSAVVQLTPRAAPLAECSSGYVLQRHERGVRQRRKMLRQSLKGLLESPVAALEALEINPTARAETLDVPAFCAIARAIEENG